MKFGGIFRPLILEINPSHILRHKNADIDFTKIMNILHFKERINFKKVQKRKLSDFDIFS